MWMLAVGCSEYALGPVPAPDPARPEPDDSPWASPDDGSVPDAAFAVAWADAGQVVGDPFGAGCDADLEPVRYSVVDARGTVLWTAEPPIAGVSWWGAHRDLAPGLPGQFLVTSETPDGGLTAWSADGLTLETAVVAVWDPATPGALWLPARGESVPLPGPVRTFAAHRTEPGVVLALLDLDRPDAGWGEDTPVVVEVDARIPGAAPAVRTLLEDFGWDPAGRDEPWIPSELLAQTYVPRALRVRRSGDVALFGVAATGGWWTDGLVGYATPAGPAYGYLAPPWPTEDRPTDAMVVSELGMFADYGQYLSRVDDDATTSTWSTDDAAALWRCGGLDAVLDHDGATLVDHVRADPSAPAHEIHVVHDGAVTWRVGSFRAGLADTPFVLRALVDLD